jgi:hypothetical protein
MIYEKCQGKRADGAVTTLVDSLGVEAEAAEGVARRNAPTEEADVIRDDTFSTP